MSDLQCAATLLITRPGDAALGLTPRGRKEARRLAESLRSARLATVYCSDAARAVQTAEIVAAALGLSVDVREALRPRSAGESAEDVLRRATSELEGIADQHRGETVLVVSHADVIGLAVPHLALNPASGAARDREPAPATVTEVAADADGWVVRGWGVPPSAAPEVIT